MGVFKPGRVPPVAPEAFVIVPGDDVGDRLAGAGRYRSLVMRHVPNADRAGVIDTRGRLVGAVGAVMVAAGKGAAHGSDEHGGRDECDPGHLSVPCPVVSSAAPWEDGPAADKTRKGPDLFPGESLLRRSRRRHSQ